MIKFQTRADVLNFVKVFGYAALQHAMDKMTISPDRLQKRYYAGRNQRWQYYP